MDAGDRGFGMGNRFEHLRIEHRVVALLAYVVLLEIVSLVVAGSVAPFGQASTTWFFACLGLLAFSLLSAPIFVPPRDSLAAGLAGLLLLASMSLGAESPIRGALGTFRWLGVAVQLVVVASAVAVVVLEHRPRPESAARGERARRLARAVSRTFGQPEAMFAPPILIGILGHFQSNQAQMLWLLFLVVLIVVIRPVEAFVQLVAEWRHGDGDGGDDGRAPLAELAQPTGHEHRDDGFAGLVVEGSTVGALRFEADDDAEIRLGSVVVAPASGRRIHYQVTGAATHEERAGSPGAPGKNGGGSRVVTAVQLGVASDGGFRKHPWLPKTNAPVFLARGDGANREPAGRLRIGTAPATPLPIGLDLEKLAEDHGAIVGAAGAGKTELALRLVRGFLAREIGVLGLDFTGELRRGLDAQEPVSIRPADERTRELEEKLDRAAGDAKKERDALRAYLRATEPVLASGVEALLEDEERLPAPLGIVELDDVPSARAARAVAESCLRTVLRPRKEHEGPRIVIVIEEDALADATPDGNGDALLERLSEILRQGSKLAVGLLVLSRGSSAASRALLARCGTLVALHPVEPACHAWLSEVLGEEHARALPDLPDRHAIAAGRALGSEVPLILELSSAPDGLEAAPETTGEADWHLA